MENKSKFIINTTANFFNASPPPSDEQSIKEFFENDAINLLAASVHEETIYFEHRIPQSEKNCLLFYKVPHLGLSHNENNNGNYDGQSELSIGLVTLEGGIVKSIYNSVSRIFSPHVLKTSDYTPEISKMIENLHTSLGTSLGLPESGIQNIQDEVNFWLRKSSNSPTKSDKDQAKLFASALLKINQQLVSLETKNSLTSIEEFLDMTHNNLDEIWKLQYHYPQNRMADLMDVISKHILEICMENMLNEDIWNSNSIHINTLITQVTEIVDSWTQICDTLTRLFWPNYNQHTWIGDPHIPTSSVEFKKRLNEIKDIKNLYKQVYSLFNNDDNFLNMLSRMFQPFKDINIFDTTPIGQQRWNKSIQQFESILEPIDNTIASILKSQLHHHLDNPRQIVHIFSKYDIITKRPVILETLTAEREHFVNTLGTLISELQIAISINNDHYDNEDLSPIVWETRWLKIVEHQIFQIEKILHICTDRNGYANVDQLLKTLKKDVATTMKENFRKWCDDSIVGVKSGNLKLRDDKPVVEFEKEGRQLMRVTFNPKIVIFCHDIREFENLGFNVAIELREAAMHAQKFMSYARALQQIASFHNTIGDRMIPCQRPIMLKNAVELSNLVQSESVAWNDEESVSRYVKILQTAVNKLSKDNALLAGYHEKAKKTIIKLMGTDLLRYGQTWKDEMRHLREIIATLESQGYTNLQAFKLHWDHQLYKVLEYQYISGLLDLNHKLPDIHVHLVFRQQKLQFKPPMEEIRSKYFSQLRRFIERPLGFRGLSDQSNLLFKTMVDRNRTHFAALYKRSVELLSKLDEIKDIWIPWVALGCIDLEQLCSVHLSTWEDWDLNFKACKHFSQQIAKIQSSEERLHCFVINLSPLRTDLEFISRRYWETLTFSLRSSIMENITTLQEFIQSALQVLQNVPLDDSGIADAGAKYEKIVNELPKMKTLLKSVQEKDTCLAGWCKERVSALNSVLLQWEQIQPLIDNHHSVLQHHIDIMKDHIGLQINNLTEEIERFEYRWEATIAELDANETSDLTLFNERQLQWKMIKDKSEHLFAEAIKFNIEFPEETKTLVDKVDRDVEGQKETWKSYEEFSKEIDEISSEEWTVYRRRPYILSDFLTKWQNIIKGEKSTVNARILSQIQKYQNLVPVLQTLQSDSLTEKHWAKIFMMLDKPPKSYHEIQLKEILMVDDRLVQSANDIQNLVRQAASEQIVRQALTELEQWGVSAILKLTPHTDSKGQTVMLIKDFQDILNKIGDNQCLLQSAKNSSAFDTFSDQAEIWETRLNSLDRILTSFNQIQRKWIYLEPIFGAGTLKSEEAIFMRIDKDFRFIMKEMLNDSRVLSVCKIHNILSLIDSLEKQLARCQNTLTSYITAKRNAFPRFYFLGNDDLLEILGQASKEPIIQKHIKKLFPGIHRVGIITKDNLPFIASIYSAEGDEIKLKNVTPINVAVEDWLNQLVTEIRFTLKELIVKCCEVVSAVTNDHNQLNEEHLKLYPMQVLCLAKSISFTKRTERAITSMGLSTLFKSIKDEIYELTKKINNTTDALVQLKIRSILLDLVHQSSIIEYLIEHNVTQQQDWHWLQQLKFYLNGNQMVIVKMVYAEFEYSYEYLGNVSKLVNTSLTHKCYLTLTQAMHLGLGGNPFGPAGTGKTECVKALGAMLGRLVLVFNCNENVDTTAMGLILSGLARCGAWGCFDEFNRLQEATLSAISMLIQPLQTALKDKQETVTILDDPLPLNLHCGIFVTLNPAGEEYGGRQNLPANLQALFRPIVMQQPEPKEIARVLLFVEGFKSAEKVGAQMVELFMLASKMLSPQRHYDWGLRELKTVLMACGKSLRQNSVELTYQEEIELAVRALRINTMSKLTIADCKRFDMLVADVFPNVIIKTSDENQLKSAIADAFASMGYISNSRQIEKCLELYEQLQKRMGVVIIGPPSSGKTTLLGVLKQALTSLSRTIRTYTIAPKSMTRTQLLGKLDPDTRQWNDGVLTTTAVAVNTESNEITSWIICDGDVDPEWIEALNSVLDDNRLLTLPSGWRIQFGNNVNFIFETHDLSHASPATISRMGIINLSSEDLNEKYIIESWLTKQTNADILRHYMEEYFQRAFNLIWSSRDRPVSDVSKIAAITCGLQFVGQSDRKDEFCVGLLRGFGSLLDADAKNQFAKQLFSWFDVYISDQSKSEFTFYNGFRDVVEIYENERNDDTDYDDNSNNHLKSNYLIQTATVKVHLDVIRNLLKIDERVPFLLYGPAGCGKTLLLGNAVTEFSGYQFITIKCSAQLTSTYVLYILRQNCLVVSGVRGREYKPRLSKLVLYFKNIDLCPIDCWGTSEVVELLMQLIHRHGFYADNLEWINITGIQICGTFSDISKGTLSPRFLSIARILVVGYPTEYDMQSIISHQFSPIFKNFNKNSLKIGTERIVDALINIYSEIKKNFTADENNHYIFTPKMVTNWIYGLMNYPQDCLQQAIYSEAQNIFGNRLISDDDRQTFEQILHSNLRDLFNFDEQSHYFIPTRMKSSQMEYLTEEMWTDLVQRNISVCSNEDVVITHPITNEMLSMVASVCRSISKKRNHLIICGPLGSCRKDSLHLAAIITHTKIFHTQLVRNYSLNDFYGDLKMAMQTAAMDDQTVVFLVDHSLISYLIDIMKPIEAVLEGSEIPDLFGDDLESIANPLRNAAQSEGYQESLASYFLKKVEENLHLVINFESTTMELKDIFSKYPALYRNTDMLFILPASQTSNEQLPKLIIDQLSPLNSPIPIIPHFYNIVQEAGDYSESPLRYIQLIHTYFYIYKNFSDEIKFKYEKLSAGVEKLSSAHSVVASLRTNAIEQEEALAEKRKLAAQALDMISSTMRNANDQKTDLLELKKKTQDSSEILKERKKAIELELKDVEPILKEASAAVGQIKTEALSEIRSLRAPPDTIRDILEGVLRLMGIRDTSWNSMKTFLAKRGVKEDIRSLDPARISPENCVAVEKLLQTKSESFEVKNAKRASIAAAPLATWVIANVKYAKVVQSIKPLEREQNELMRNLEESENQMKSLVSGLDDVDARVKELSTQLNGYTQEAAVIEIKLQDARNTLKSAELLIDKLNSEYVSWSKQLDVLNLELKTLDWKSFFVGLCITHFSHLPLEQKMEYLTSIMTSLNIAHLNIDTTLITDQNKLHWESMGLTPDNQSMQNAAILIKFFIFPYRVAPIPLLVDPSGACYKWIQAYLASQNKSFETTAQNAERFTYQLELAIRFGKILIVQDAQTIVPPLLGVLTSELHSRFNKRMLQVGNKFVDLHDDFKLVLFTKMHRVSVKEELRAYLTPIPFTITVSGLTDQLLSKTISLKRPELEEKRIALLKNEGDLWKQRYVLQDKLLHELSTAQGDILKNDKLIKTLNDVKESSTSIDKSLLESTEIRKKLMEDYNQFKELCSNTSKFYVGISKIYYISISTFVTIFLQVLEKSENFDGDAIYRKIIRLTYGNISRSVIKSKHLALALCTCKYAYPDQITNKEWESFVTNFITSDDTIDQSSTLPSWIKKDLVPKIISLKLLHPNLYQQLRLDDERLWQQYYDGTATTNYDGGNKVYDVPVGVTEFQKIMIAQILRPDQMVGVMMKSVAKILGLNTLSMPQPTIEQIIDESKNDEPILFITLSGTDPSKELKDFAQHKIGLNKYIEMSVGKGIEEKSTLALRKAVESGYWICLKNIHLIPDWLKVLDSELSTQQQSSKLHADFRLFLTCESMRGFPDLFMSKCNKILYEAPDGVKNKIQRLLQQWGQMLNGKRDPKVLKLYIILFILNSILLERRSFIPQGWCKWYDFGDADLRAAIDFIKSMEKLVAGQMDWSVLRGLCQNIAYGGRIDNNQDLKILIRHLEDFFDNQVMTSRWSPNGLNVTMPQTNRIQDYYTMVSQLPDLTGPEMFGLAKTTNLSKDLNVCRNLLKELRSSYFNTNEAENFDKRMKPVFNLWKKLTNGTTLIINTSKTPNELEDDNGKGLQPEEDEEEETSPWKAFLLSEMRIAKSLFSTIHASLITLHSSMKQMTTMTNDEKALLLTLCENHVPLKWRKLWSGPKLTLDYIKAVSIRGFEAERRLKDYVGEIFCEKIDFVTIFNVDALLAGLKLANAREISESTCDLELQVKSEKTERSNDNQISITIKPLMIDGASFKQHKLSIIDESNSRKNAYYSPEFQITYVKGSGHKHTKSNSIFMLPLYSNITRETFICNLPVEMINDKNSIIYSGAALIVPYFPQNN